MTRRTIAIAACLALGAVGGAPTAEAAKTRSCGSISNPYPDTRFEDADLTRIQATRASCRTARRVARGAHRKALGLTPGPSGVRRFSWDGWSVTGDLRGSRDSYLATRRGHRVRWRF